MRVYIKPLPDDFERKERAQHLLQACEEFGAKPISDGPDYFNVEFGEFTTRAQVQQFLEAVEARGVSLDKSDARALSQDRVQAAVLNGAMERGEIPTEKLLPEDIWTSVDSADIPQDTAADDVYTAIRELRGEEPSEDNIFSRPQHEDDDPFGTKEMDKQLTEMWNSGEAKKYHRAKGF